MHGKNRFARLGFLTYFAEYFGWCIYVYTHTQSAEGRREKITEIKVNLFYEEMYFVSLNCHITRTSILRISSRVWVQCVCAHLSKVETVENSINIFAVISRFSVGVAVQNCQKADTWVA